MSQYSCGLGLGLYSEVSSNSVSYGFFPDPSWFLQGHRKFLLFGMVAKSDDNNLGCLSPKRMGAVAAVEFKVGARFQSGHAF